MGECAKLLSAHMAPGGRVGVPCSLCKHASVLQSGGSTAAMEAPPPLHTANTRQPNNRVWLRGRQANTLANGTFIYLSSRPPPPPPTSFIYWDPQCHFQEPHGNSGPCQRGGQLSHDVTAPCDWRSAAERQNSVGDPNGTDIWTLELRLDLCSDLCIRLCIL